MKQVGPVGGIMPLLEKRVNLQVRFALLLSLLRSPSVLLPLFWLIGRGIIVLGCLAARSRKPL